MPKYKGTDTTNSTDRLLWLADLEIRNGHGLNFAIKVKIGGYYEKFRWNELRVALKKYREVREYVRIKY